ncbi:MAG: hypothetical protein QOG28_1270 [Trebonia sp.]|nr:hypothetical protein [Trebonia sp.]
MDNPQQSFIGPPPGAPDPDPEWAEYVAWLDREGDAGRDAQPEIWAAEAREPWDPESGEPVWPRFGQGDEADVLPPSPFLIGLTEEAICDLGRLSDNELIGVLQATRRQIAREQYKQVLATAEFGRRRQAAFDAAASRGIPVGCRPGGFPGEELATELVMTPAEAGHRIDDAIDLTTRLPMTLAGMAAGQIDEARAGWIAMYTRSLTPADAARADEILAAAAPDLREDRVARKAAALEKKFAPEAVKARKERTKRNEQRVEARRELSGNASLSGREMDTADAMASKAYLDAIAVKLRNGGLAGSLGALRVLAMADLTQGRNPLDRLKPQDPGTPQSADPSTPGCTDPDAWPGWGPDDADDPEGFRCDDPLADGVDDPGRSRPAPRPMPAQISLIVPIGTLLGWSTFPAQAGAWGLLDSDETRTIVDAAAQHPRTRWCCTLTAPDGTALAHACARGQHPQLLNDLEPQPPPAQLAELLRRLNLTFTPVARGTCDHAEAEDQYVPSRKLKHLIHARTTSCDAPGCQAQATYADLEHTIPWPEGPSDQCNLAPRCRTHHRAKQAPDWKVEQPEPGVTRWTLPSGRAHTTTPTQYDT